MIHLRALIAHLREILVKINVIGEIYKPEEISFLLHIACMDDVKVVVVRAVQLFSDKCLPVKCLCRSIFLRSRTQAPLFIFREGFSEAKLVDGMANVLHARYYILEFARSLQGERRGKISWRGLA